MNYKKLGIVSLLMVILSILTSNISIFILWLYLFLVVYFKAFIPNRKKRLGLFILRRCLYIILFLLPTISTLIYFKIINIYYPKSILYLLVSVLFPLIYQFAKMWGKNIKDTSLLLALTIPHKPIIFIIHALFLLLNSIAEEGIFRITLSTVSSNKFIQFITSLIIFVFIHNINYFSLNNKTYRIKKIVLYFVATLFLWLLYWTSNNFIYPIIAHIAFNIPSIYIYLLAAKTTNTI